jgi:hypothetical protein
MEVQLGHLLGWILWTLQGENANSDAEREPGLFATLQPVIERSADSVCCRYRVAESGVGDRFKPYFNRFNR